MSVINPLQAHHFAKAQLRRAKTDPLDAQNLAQLAAALQPALWTPPPTVYHEVRQRLTARDALVAMRQQTRNQRHALLQWPVVVAAVREHLDGVIAMHERLAECALSRDADGGAAEIRIHIGSTANSLLALLDDN